MDDCKQQTGVLPPIHRDEIAESRELPGFVGLAVDAVSEVYNFESHSVSAPPEFGASVDPPRGSGGVNERCKSPGGQSDLAIQFLNLDQEPP
jgi:chemotaxis signal transduction protein